jgi:hypothetical protein
MKMENYKMKKKKDRILIIIRKCKNIQEINRKVKKR